MTIELFLILLSALSIVTSLFTEAVKKALNDLSVKYAANIVVLFVAVIVGGAGTAIFYLWNGFAFNTLNVICIFLMVCANWLCAMLGYDKVMQAIAQMKAKRGL